jgi:hypothetical protein
MRPASVIADEFAQGVRRLRGLTPAAAASLKRQLFDAMNEGFACHAGFQYALFSGLARAGIMDAATAAALWVALGEGDVVERVMH